MLFLQKSGRVIEHVFQYVNNCLEPPYQVGYSFRFSWLDIIVGSIHAVEDERVDNFRARHFESDTRVGENRFCHWASGDTLYAASLNISRIMKVCRIMTLRAMFLGAKSGTMPP